MKVDFWEDFLIFFKKKEKTAPIVYSALRNIRSVEINGDQLTLNCQNQPVKIFLEKNISLIEKSLAVFTNKNIDVLLIIEEKKKTNIKEQVPLLAFKPSLDDVFLRSGLYNKYRFDNFAVSPTNQVAYAAAQAVAKNPGSAYNPLFIYGGVGVGKTHLAQAAARQVLEHDNAKKVFFCPGDQFTNELIEGIRERSTPRFRKKYRFLNLLVIDDIQFIAGKETVQEEFFHTFNSIVSGGGQIILTSDRVPSSISKLEDRLRSRFSGGLIVDVQSPDFELRTAILLIKAQEKNIEVDMEAARAISEQIVDSRALEGTLLSIYAKILGQREKIDLEAVDSFFHQKITNQIRKTSSGDIIRAVCSYYNVRQSQLRGSQRSETVAFPRQITMYLLRHELKLKLEEIAHLLKRKDHTTVIHGVNKINGLLIKNPAVKQEVDRIILSLGPST
jgi:chromosomal replication initiator protein